MSPNLGCLFNPGSGAGRWSVSSGAASQGNIKQYCGGLDRANSVLQDRFAEFYVSRQQLRQAESIQLVRDRREAGNQRLGFASRPFCALWIAGETSARLCSGVRAADPTASKSTAKAIFGDPDRAGLGSVTRR